MTFTTNGTDLYSSISELKMRCDIRGLDVGDAIDKFKFMAEVYGWEFSNDSPLALEEVVQMGNLGFERLMSVDGAEPAV